MREGHQCLGYAGAAVENRPDLLIVAEHNRSIDTVSLGEDDPDLEDPWSGGRAEGRFEFVKKLLTAPVLGTS